VRGIRNADVGSLPPAARNAGTRAPAVVRLPGADRLDDSLIGSNLDTEPIVVALEGNRCRSEPNRMARYGI
jgi:hypothetical protein